MREFVLDCSVTLCWAFPDECDQYATAVRDALRQCRAYVPSIWWLETANGLLAAERKGRLSEADATQFARLVSFLPIAFDDRQPGTAMDELMGLARRHSLTAYDAVYLDVALRRGLAIATLDKALVSAAAAAGVPRFEA